MGIGAAIGGVATLASGLFGANAASQASQAQVQMQQQALALQQQMFNKTQQNLSPYMGTDAMASGADEIAFIELFVDVLFGEKSILI